MIDDIYLEIDDWEYINDFMFGSYEMGHDDWVMKIYEEDCKERRKRYGRRKPYYYIYKTYEYCKRTEGG